MGDMRSMNREMKKKQLRNNIVQLPNQNPPTSYQAEEDSEEVIRNFQRGRRRKRFLITLIVVVFLAVLGFCWYQYQNEYEYTEYTVGWEHAMRFVDAEADEADAESADKVVGESGFVNFAYFGENMI